MDERIADGAWRDPPSRAPGRDEARRAQADRLRARRDSARWSAVVGFALLFAASFSSAFLFGGVAMILYGVGAAMVWSRQLRRLEGDPWAYDPELDGPDAPDWSKRP